MSLKRSAMALIVGVALFSSCGLLFAQDKDKKNAKVPPYHTGGALLAEPAPLPPPPGPGSENNPLVLLSRPQNYSAARVSSFARNGGNLDTVSLPPSGEEITIADLKGPGAITHIWTTFRGNGRDLIIRIYWEGSDHPSVEAPIGDFFGVAMGINASINSYPIQDSSEGRARNCWWHMPFNKSARVTISNVRPVGPAGEKNPIALYYYIDYRVTARPVKDINYFHVRFSEMDPTERGKPVTLLEAEGDGHFVGVVMGHRARTPGWFGEGDDIITTDGKVAFVGTGTEDYFCDAWGFRVFSDLYHGVPVYEGREIGNRLSAYRFHVIDPIPFRKSFKFEIEHWPWVSPWPNTGREYYSSAGFWYQKSLHKPWPRLTHLISHESWEPAKGRWNMPGAIEAEDLGILEYKSKAMASIPTTSPPPSAEASTGEQLRSLLQFGGRPFAQFLMPNLSGDFMLSFDSGGEGKFSLAVPVKEAGTYALKMFYVRGDSFGIVQLAVNGQRVGDPTDLFLKTVEGLTRPIWPPQEFIFPGVPLKEGLNVFEFAVNSKNAASTAYRFGLDCIVLEKRN